MHSVSLKFDSQSDPHAGRLRFLRSFVDYMLHFLALQKVVELWLQTIKVSGVLLHLPVLIYLPFVLTVVNVIKTID